RDTSASTRARRMIAGDERSDNMFRTRITLAVAAALTAASCSNSSGPGPTGAPLYVAGNSNGSVTVFQAATVGSSTPNSSISGSNPTLTHPWGVTTDASGKIYATEQSTNSVLVFASGASGNVAPVTTISGANTLLNAPHGIAVDAAGIIYVANGNNKILI